jgi:hypothetical protein
MKFASFRDVIDLWPSREAMAADLAVGSSSVVSKWWQRDSIPAEWWAAVLATEKARESGLTAEVLTVLASRESPERRSDANSAPAEAAE